MGMNGGTMKTFVLGFLLFIATASATYAFPADAIGQIQTLTGSATIIRGQQTIPAAVGTALYLGDLVRTGKPGAIGIVLTDDTTISLGPNSELSLTDYSFDPKQGKFSLIARMIKGTFVYLSGLIGKLAPNAIKLLIPDATISVRGTKLLIEVQQ
jgi:hypothetical protein